MNEASLHSCAGAWRIVDSIFPKWCDERLLTPAERRVVRFAVDGVAREDLAATLGVAPSTIKTQVHSICQKARAKTFRDVVIAVLRAAIESTESRA